MIEKPGSGSTRHGAEATQPRELNLGPDSFGEEEEEAVQHPRRWTIFGIVVTAMFMGSIDQSVVATALPTLHQSLHAPINWVAWTVTVYQLGLVIALPVAGRISDQFGRKKVFVTCLMIFGISSLACGAAPNIWTLICFRFIQALGAGGFMPSATGIVADHFGSDRDRGIGMFATVGPLGLFLGPIIGGGIIYFWSWRGVFLINIPITIAVVILATLIIPHSEPRETAAVDYKGVALLVSIMLPMMYGITSLGNGKTTVTSPRFFVPELVALCVGYAFVRHCGRTEEPVIPIHMLRIRAFATMNAVSFMFGGCILGFASLVPLYAEDRYHFVPIQAGTVLSARAIGTILSAGLATYLLHRTGYRRPMILGFTLVAVGLALVGYGAHDVTPYVWLTISGCILGIGSGIATPATNNAVLSFSPSSVASISGLRGMFRQMGAIVVISVTSSIVTRSLDPGIALAHAFLIISTVVVLVVLPLVMTVPDRSGKW